MKYLVYALIDPRTNLIRYVGKSSSGMTRVRDHRKLRKHDRTYCAHWLRQLETEGLKHLEHVLEVLECEDGLNDSEMWWISFGRACGWPLTNMTDGGEGATGRVVSQEECDLLSERNRRKWEGPEYREWMSQALSDRWRDPEFRLLMDGVRRHQWDNTDFRSRFSGENHWMKRPEVRAKISGDNGSNKRPEVRAKLSEAAVERWSDPEFRASSSEAFRVARQDPERRAARSARVTAQWQDPERRTSCSENMKRRWEDPEYRAKMSEAFRTRKPRKPKAER